jgi:hypothetical protein
MKQTDANAVAPSHLRDVHALSKALADDAGFLLTTPAPAAVDPADHLDTPTPAAADIYVLRTMMITMRIVFAVHRQPRTRFARRRIIPDQASQQHVGRSCQIPLKLLANGLAEVTQHPSVSRETVRRRLDDNDLKPWQKKMWCVARTQDFKNAPRLAARINFNPLLSRKIMSSAGDLKGLTLIGDPRDMFVKRRDLRQTMLLRDLSLFRGYGL